MRFNLRILLVNQLCLITLRQYYFDRGNCILEIYFERLKDISQLCGKHSCMNKETFVHSGCVKVGARTKLPLREDEMGDTPPYMTPMIDL